MKCFNNYLHQCRSVKRIGLMKRIQLQLRLGPIRSSGSRRNWGCIDKSRLRMLLRMMVLRMMQLMLIVMLLLLSRVLVG